MAQKEHCAYCFDVLLNHFDSSHEVIVPELPAGKFPLFVTWKKREAPDSKEYDLRGCIGTFSAQRLDKGLRDYALTSALRDSRFNPMKQNELPELSCAISFLTNFEPAKAYNDWEVGVHGIQIEFSDSRGQMYNATYLPEVAEEQGWDHDECIDSLIRKAGYRGSVDKTFRSKLKVVRYQSSKCSLTYQEYVEMRKPATEKDASIKDAKRTKLVA